MRIDSLSKFDELIATGMPENEARALAHSLAEVSQIDMNEIASKTDLKELEMATKTDFKELKKEIKHLETLMYIGGALTLTGFGGVFTCLFHMLKA